MKILNKPSYISTIEIEKVLDKVLKESRIKKFKKKNKNIVIEFINSELDEDESCFNWNLHLPKIIINMTLIRKKMLKLVITHEFIHYLDFINNGKWDAELPHRIAKNKKDYYFCCPHELLAENIAQKLFGHKNWKDLPYRIIRHNKK